MAFHFDPDKKGRNIQLTNGNQTVVAADTRFDDKGVVTKEPIRPGELFSVRVDRLGDGNFMNGLVRLIVSRTYKNVLEAFFLLAPDLGQSMLHYSEDVLAFPYYMIARLQ